MKKMKFYLHSKTAVICIHTRTYERDGQSYRYLKIDSRRKLCFLFSFAIMIKMMFMSRMMDPTTINR